MEKTEIEKAQEIIQAEEQTKQKLFQEEYQAISKKYGYGFSPIIEMSPEGNIFGMRIIKV